MKIYRQPASPWPPWQRADVVFERARYYRYFETSAPDRATRERRASARWPADWPQEGWLQMQGNPAEPVQVALVDFSSGGSGIVLTALYPLQPAQLGTLTTQAHGAGCTTRPVRCSWQSPHPSDRSLQSAGLCLI